MKTLKIFLEIAEGVGVGTTTTKYYGSRYFGGGHSNKNGNELQ